MREIYDKHAKAFERVQAFVILKGGEIVGHVHFKFPQDGAGRLTAFVHFLGTEMVFGTASGYGYDKRTAAVAAAAAKLPDCPQVWHSSMESAAEIVAAMRKDGGQHFDSAIREVVGYDCRQVL